MNDDQMAFDGFSILSNPCKQLADGRAGKQANLSGKAAEDTIFCILKERGYAVQRHYALSGVSLHGGRIIVDFFVQGIKKYPDGLIIESKWQDDRGSADEKLLFLAENVKRRYTCPTILVYGGKGARIGILEYVTGQVDNQKLIAVFSFEEFLSWTIRNL